MMLLKLRKSQKISGELPARTEMYNQGALIQKPPRWGMIKKNKHKWTDISQIKVRINTK